MRFITEMTELWPAHRIIPVRTTAGGSYQKKDRPGCAPGRFGYLRFLRAELELRAPI